MKQYDVEYGWWSGFCQSFQANNVHEALKQANAYMHTKDYQSRIPNTAFQSIIFQVLRVDADKQVIVFDYFNGVLLGTGEPPPPTTRTIQN